MIPIIYYVITCVDLHDFCYFWSTKNECEKNSRYMYRNCKKSCNVCNTSCDMEKLNVSYGYFERLVENINNSEFDITMHSKKPVLIEVGNFLKDNESQQIIDVCHNKFERSLAGTGVTESRTSEQCWCNTPDCTEKSIIKSVEERASKLLNINYSHAEYMQVLKYSPGQYYKVHHDQNSGHDSIQGPRIITFFMYLNTLEEGAGGETEFPNLNVSIRPKKNSAVLWNSISDEAPNVDEHETYHEAKPVIDGYKYAANLWFHTGPFRTMDKYGCELQDIPTYVPKKKTKEEL